MTIQQIRYFIEVANCRSFSRAAASLHLSQPNLTKYIAKLEKVLGFRLFDRTTHRVELTEAGHRLLQKVEIPFSQVNRAIEESRIAGQYRDVETVVLGVSRDERLPEKLTGLLYELNTAPGGRFRYELSQDSYSGLIARLRERQYDAIVTTDRNIERSAAVNFLYLRPFELLLAVSRRSPLAQREHLTPQECGGPVYFALPEGHEASQQVLDTVFRRTGGVELRLMSSPSDLMLNVQAGAGVAVVSGLIDQESYPDAAFYRFDEWHGQAQRLAWRSDDESAGLRVLIERLRELYPDIRFCSTDHPPRPGQQ